MTREIEVGKLKSNTNTCEVRFVMKEYRREMNFMMNYLSKVVTRGRNRQWILNGLVSIQVLEGVLIIYKT